MINSILGKKVGMTRIFDETGKRISVTVVAAGPCVVQQVKTQDKDGYNAVQLGFDDKKEKHVKKPQLTYLKAKNLVGKRFVREVRCEAAPELKVGDAVAIDMFQKGDFVDVIGISKGKGYQGGMKRCNWYGGPESHGSMSHRAPGSIGASSYPKKVDKGHPFPGHMGNVRKTLQNLEVVEVDADSATIAVKGAVPGAKGAYVMLRFAKKKKIAQRIAKNETEAENK